MPSAKNNEIKSDDVAIKADSELNPQPAANDEPLHSENAVADLNQDTDAAKSVEEGPAADESLKAENETLKSAISEHETTIAQLRADLAAAHASASVAAVDAAPTAKIYGHVLDLPDEMTAAKAEDVAALLADGGKLELALTDESGVVQPYRITVGGDDVFLLSSVSPPSVLFLSALEIDHANAACEIRYAVLCNQGGNPLAACRFGAMLKGGGGFSALLPEKTIKFWLSA